MSLLLDNIKKEANKRGYSLRKLNDLAGLKPNIIYSWSKQEPSLTSLQKVADVLHVSTDNLLGRNEETNTSFNKENSNSSRLDKEIIMAFDGQPIPDEDKEKLLEFARFLRSQRGK